MSSIIGIYQEMS